MGDLVDNNKIHLQFHEILGHLTTIRAALWDMEQSSNLPNDVTESLIVAKNHAENLVTQVEQLRNEIIPPTKN